jgi:two-component system cell cycle sensor histidine kinase/response regulator CckA
MAHIFEPFYTTKGVGKGTGLGLAMVYGIIKQSGGYIDVYSEINKGATFDIYLPLLKQDSKSRVCQGIELNSCRGSETILLVEDEETVRHLAKKVLSNYGYDVLEAQYGEEAIHIVAESAKSIHLIITDVVMPKMSGIKMVEKLQLMLPKVKILYISGYTEETLGQHGVLAENTSFLQKPFEPEQLIRTVRAILDSGSSQR